MERYKIYDRKGEHAFWIEGSTHVTARFGQYEFCVEHTVDNYGPPYIVVCNPELRREGEWNFTRFSLEEGNIHFMDDDVQLDPYHMCLLYQHVQEYEAARRDVGLERNQP